MMMMMMTATTLETCPDHEAKQPINQTANYGTAGDDYNYNYYYNYYQWMQPFSSCNSIVMFEISTSHFSLITCCYAWASIVVLLLMMMMIIIGTIMASKQLFRIKPNYRSKRFSWSEPRRITSSAILRKQEFLSRVSSDDTNPSNDSDYGYPQSPRGYIDGWRPIEFPQLIPPIQVNKHKQQQQQQ